MIDASSSARTFGLMGGLYAAVNCIMMRLRQRQDAWNSAASGCATGLVLGWKGGPVSALQSCGMLGIFSYFLEGMAGGDSAQAATIFMREVNPNAKCISLDCLRGEAINIPLRDRDGEGSDDRKPPLNTGSRHADKVYSPNLSRYNCFDHSYSSMFMQKSDRPWDGASWTIDATLLNYHRHDHGRSDFDPVDLVLNPAIPARYLNNS